jgi:SAM-dependent methyltransferase
MYSRIELIYRLLKEGLDPGQTVSLLTLRNAIAGCEDVLDVGCGKTNNMRRLGIKHSTGIDGYAPYLEEAKQKNLHDQYVLGDVRDLEKYFKPGQFDTVLALDVIEHLPKEDGLRMMRSMEKIARRKVVLFTPSGFLPQKSYENNDLQEHLSGWEPAEMEQYGYKVIGVLGPKSLRGEMQLLKGRPKAFWGAVSLLGHFLWTRWSPVNAAAILCVKTKS